MPRSKSSFGLILARGLGFKSFLKLVNKNAGMAPLEEDVRGGWGGFKVAGGGSVGLKTA
jgi:hypothetical protein